jgi:amidophosphoribosyltransferase
MKFNSLPGNLAGKRVVLIDDSLVRGTTAGPLVALLREAGASEVHVRITCPPIVNACHFGVDMGHDDDLIASHKTVDEIRRHVGADSLEFLSVSAMMAALQRGSGYCNACFTGEYPVEITKRHSKSQFDQVLA